MPAFLIIAMCFLLFAAMNVKAEELTRSERFGTWLREDVGGAVAGAWRGLRGSTEDDSCAEQVRDMTIECLDELEELARDVITEIEVERGVRRGRRK